MHIVAARAGSYSQSSDANGDTHSTFGKIKAERSGTYRFSDIERHLMRLRPFIYSRLLPIQAIAKIDNSMERRQPMLSIIMTGIKFSAGGMGVLPLLSGMT
jgi:hypothetical protein